MSVYRELEAELRQRGRDLEEADRLKDQFLATLAHELRTPLAALSLAGQRLRLAGAVDRIGFVADVIDKETTHMAQLVEELLDVARVRQGKVNLHMEAVDIVAVAEQAAETSRPLIDGRGHTLEIVQSSASVRVLGDETRLCQVVVNLLTNAARYTPKGGHVRLMLDKDDRDAIIRVEDGGVGITADMLPRLFDLFTQVRHAELDAGGGLGIGLALVKNLVALHGGSVNASSAGPGLGSEFVVRIPLLVEH
jgi:signal transduction histidine kinase